MTKEQLLKGTAEFYNSGNRAIKASSGHCCYSRIPRSPGCAIGRHLSEAQARDFDLRGVMLKVIYPELPSELKELSVDFLVAIQKLHDVELNWNELGLSECGKKVYNKIIVKFRVGIPLLEVP